MNPLRLAPRVFLLLIGSLAIGHWSSVSAFPPTPDHTFYGMVRNEWGDPITARGATLYIQSTNGSGASGPVTASTEPGVNYRLAVPMDSGRSRKADPAAAGSLRESQPFRLKVQIGDITYLPIEMVASRPLGAPAGTTRLNLTLGEDSDSDGLPDAWEVANGLNPSDATDAGKDSDSDGIPNRDEDLAGTIAYDATDGFRLALKGLSVEGNSTLEFFAVRGRTYRIQGSSDLRQWTPLSFRFSTGPTVGPIQSEYVATDYRQLLIEVPFEQGTETNRYFRALVQIVE